MSHFTSLPTELMEQIASYMERAELLALRLAHPRIFPAYLMRALQGHVRWNARNFSRYPYDAHLADCLKSQYPRDAMTIWYPVKAG